MAGRQAIIWTNAEILLIRTLEIKQWYLKRNPCFFIQENEIENVVCEMASILSRPQYVKAPKTRRFCWRGPAVAKHGYQEPILLTWFNSNPCMDK